MNLTTPSDKLEELSQQAPPTQIMASNVPAVQYGGHDYEFVDKVPDRFICQICTKVLRDPHLAVCCGQHFCKSCLNKWFARQGKESCPHCRAEGEGFNHVIHKGLRSEVNHLKIRCSNHGEGCQWTGELGTLKQHLESNSGCGYVLVECPNKCYSVYMDRLDIFEEEILTILKRKDLEVHVTTDCYLRPYQCEFCGHKDTYKAITGQGLYLGILTFNDPYGGHQAKCPKVPLKCPNKCGMKNIKRKDMEGHRRQCPQEPVECPFAEAGCKEKLKRYQLNTHVTSSMQEHLSLIMKDYQETKSELHTVKGELLEVKGTLATAVQLLRQGTEADKETVDLIVASSVRLEKRNDLVKVTMPKFSEYRRSGKVWHSPPFYYREGYKMCLAVHANGVGEGAGTHVSVTLTLLKGEHGSAQHRPAPSKCDTFCHKVPTRQKMFNICQYQPLSQHSEAIKELSHDEKFFIHEYVVSKLVNDCLTFNIKYYDQCYLVISVN